MKLKAHVELGETEHEKHRIPRDQEPPLIGFHRPIFLKKYVGGRTRTRARSGGGSEGCGTVTKITSGAQRH
jgi:hypothetical protein